MKYNIGDFVKDSGSRTLLIIATKEQKLDYNYLQKQILKIEIELTEHEFIVVGNGFDYKAVEVKYFEKNGNLILNKQSNFRDYFENDLSR